MVSTKLGLRSRFAVLAALSLTTYVACGDDEDSPSQSSGGRTQSTGGSSAGTAQSGGGAGGSGGKLQGGGGGSASGGRSGGTTSQTEGGAVPSEGGATLAEGGATQTEGGAAQTEGGAGQSQGGATQTEGGATQTEGGTAQAEGGAGGTGEPGVTCDYDLVDGMCPPPAPFQRVQSAKRRAGRAASMDVVNLSADTVSGNSLVLGVGVVWNKAAGTVTVPAGFNLLERRDNNTGTTNHETIAVYITEDAPVLAATTGATVSVDDIDARIYLVLAEYAGLRASEVLDQKVSQAGSGPPSPGTTELTTSYNQLWLMLAVSRGGGGHSAPTNDFTLAQSMATGAGSFSLSERLVSERGRATSSLTASGDYAALLVTLRR